jgi:G3E family GTPase
MPSNISLLERSETDSVLPRRNSGVIPILYIRKIDYNASLSKNNFLKKGVHNLRVIIIGGFLGSGKTTTVLKISRQFTESGKKVAIIVNEIGEIGLDGDILTSSDIVTEELTSGCICCTLRISMQYTLQTLEEEFNPDIVIIEPTGIAFPAQIKEEIETMGLLELSFAPIITLVDPGRFGTEAKEIPKFIETQIKEAEILCINKIDIMPAAVIRSTEEMLYELNPQAGILKFSAKLGDEQFEKLLLYLEASDSKNSLEEKKNSIELSEVSAYSALYSLILNDTLKNLRPETGSLFIEESLRNIQDKLRKINPEFIGHVKLSLKTPEFTGKGSVVSSRWEPQTELASDRKSEISELRVLSAVTKVPKDELVKIVDETLEERFSAVGINFVKSISKDKNKKIIKNISEYKNK